MSLDLYFSTKLSKCRFFDPKNSFRDFGSKSNEFSLIRLCFRIITFHHTQHYHFQVLFIKYLKFFLSITSLTLHTSYQLLSYDQHIYYKYPLNSDQSWLCYRYESRSLFLYQLWFLKLILCKCKGIFEVILINISKFAYFSNCIWPGHTDDMTSSL